MAATAEQINATIDAYVATFSAGDRSGYLGLWACLLYTSPSPRDS